MATSATVAEAATFTVNYSGSVDRLARAPVSRNPGAPPTAPDEVDSLTTLNTSAAITIQDTLVGSYTFEDTTNELLSSRFRFVSPGSDVSLNPFDVDSSDITFEPLPDFSTTSVFGISQRETTANAEEDAASYRRAVFSAQQIAGTTNSFSVNSQRFSYNEFFSSQAQGGGGDFISATINEFSLVEGGPDPSDPDMASVPEPSTAVGLLVLASLGLATSRRERTSIRHT